MWLIVIGILMIGLKFFDVDFMQSVSWLWCILPFGLAFIYWEFIDSVFNFSAKSEMKKQMRKESKRKRKQAEEMLSGRNSRR